MLNIIIKSAIFCAVPKLINEIYEPTKKLINSGIQEMREIFFDDEVEKVVKKKIKKDTTPITRSQYNFIMDTFNKNNALPQKSKVTQVELTKLLNEKLNLNKSRSGYCHIWMGRYNQKRIIDDTKT